MSRAAANEALMRRYYELYNAPDEAGLCALLGDDVELQFPGAEQRGRSAYVATYRHMTGRFRDIMTPTAIDADDDGATVEIRDSLTALMDGEFMGRRVSAGEELVVHFTARYTIDDGVIRRIVIAPSATA